MTTRPVPTTGPVANSRKFICEFCTIPYRSKSISHALTNIAYSPLISTLDLIAQVFQLLIAMKNYAVCIFELSILVFDKESNDMWIVLIWLYLHRCRSSLKMDQWQKVYSLLYTHCRRDKLLEKFERHASDRRKKCEYTFSSNSGLNSVTEHVAASNKYVAASNKYTQGRGPYGFRRKIYFTFLAHDKVKLRCTI